jgi:hypothetical protein
MYGYIRKCLYCDDARDVKDKEPYESCKHEWKTYDSVNGLLQICDVCKARRSYENEKSPSFVCLGDLSRKKEMTNTTIINKLPEKKVYTFKDIKIGEFFYYMGQLLLKMDIGGVTGNCWNVEENKYLTFWDTAVVIPAVVEIHVLKTL